MGEILYIWTLERDREQSLFWLVAVAGAGGGGVGSGGYNMVTPSSMYYSIYLSSTMFKKSIGYRLALPLVVSEFSV